MHLQTLSLKRIIYCLFVFITFHQAFAQSGTSVYSFLHLPISARQSALGGDAVSIRDYDVSFAGVNPSLMNLDMDRNISINYADYLADSKFGTISYVQDLNHGHLLGINARYIDYGKMPRTDENANISGEFGAIDASLGIAYAYQFEEDWTIGTQLSYVTSKIDYFTSSAISGNFGITYYDKEEKETIALVLRNFGYQLKTFNGVREKMPFRIDMGYTKILKEFPIALTLSIHDLQQFNISQQYNNNGQEVGFVRKIADHLSFGAELFPEQAFNLRLGYNVKRGNELAVLDQRSFTGLSFGFGIKIASFRFDYSHVRYHNAANLNQIGISLDMIQLSGRRR